MVVPSVFRRCFVHYVVRCIVRPSVRWFVLYFALYSVGTSSALYSVRCSALRSVPARYFVCSVSVGPAPCLRANIYSPAASRHAGLCICIRNVGRARGDRHAIFLFRTSRWHVLGGYNLGREGAQLVYLVPGTVSICCVLSSVARGCAPVVLLTPMFRSGVGATDTAWGGPTSSTSGRTRKSCGTRPSRPSRRSCTTSAP